MIFLLSKNLFVLLGGIVDIIVYLRFGEGILDEVRLVSGGFWGGKFVDDRFEKFLGEVIGNDFVEDLK